MQKHVHVKTVFLMSIYCSMNAKEVLKTLHPVTGWFITESIMWWAEEVEAGPFVINLGAPFFYLTNDWLCLYNIVDTEDTKTVYLCFIAVLLFQIWLLSFLKICKLL